MRTAYKKHNLYVESVVPQEDLLIWNVKDGWEPLCKFMGKPIPDGQGQSGGQFEHVRELVES